MIVSDFQNTTLMKPHFQMIFSALSGNNFDFLTCWNYTLKALWFEEETFQREDMVKFSFEFQPFQPLSGHYKSKLVKIKMKPKSNVFWNTSSYNGN